MIEFGCLGFTFVGLAKGLKSLKEELGFVLWPGWDVDNSVSGSGVIFGDFECLKF